MMESMTGKKQIPAKNPSAVMMANVCSTWIPAKWDVR